MKSVPGVATAVLVIATTAPVLAQVDCADWNTGPFYWNGDVSDVARCMQTGADPNARDGGGRTPLHNVAPSGNPGMVRALLAAGADPNTRDRWGETPLHEVALWGNAGMVRVLLAAGADPTARDDSGQTPLNAAMYFRNDIDAGTVTALLEAGADPMARRPDGDTPLHRAAEGGREDAIRALLAAGADPRARGRNGYMPLHLAAHSGYEGVVGALLGAGADLEARTGDGRTPLHFAAAAPRAADSAVTALLEAGADPNARTVNGRTPLHLAAVGRSDEVAMTLLAAGADLEARTADGRTPLNIAVRRAPSVANALRAAGAEPDALTLALQTQAARADAAIGVAGYDREDDRRFCVGLPEANLAPGTAVTLIFPDPPQPVLTGEIDRAVTVVPGGRNPDRGQEPAGDADPLLTVCQSLESGSGAAGGGRAYHYYLVERDDATVVRGVQNLVWLAFLGRVPTSRTDEGDIAVGFTDGRPSAHVRACTSTEMIHLMVWAGAPYDSARLWHRSYYLGYSAVASCDDRAFIE